MFLIYQDTCVRQKAFGQGHQDDKLMRIADQGCYFKSNGKSKTKTANSKSLAFSVRHAHFGAL